MNIITEVELAPIENIDQVEPEDNKVLTCIVDYHLHNMPTPFIDNFYLITPIFVLCTGGIWGFTQPPDVVMRQLIIQKYENSKMVKNKWYYIVDYTYDLNALKSRALRDLTKIAEINSNGQERISTTQKKPEGQD